MKADRISVERILFLAYRISIMKRTFHVLLNVVLSFAAATILIGCSKESGAKRVDVQANINALKNPDKDARANALVELGEAKEKAAPAVPALIPLLKDNDPETRRLAAYVLGEIGPQAKAALAPLKEMLNDTDRQVVMQVVNSIRSVDPTTTDLKNVAVSGEQ